MRATTRETEAIRAYVEDQSHEAVVHAEKAATELVGPVHYDIWDVHCERTRWWVITNPTNLYDQEDFRSRDVALTFHIGLMLRVEYGREGAVPVLPEPAQLLPGSWRRWQQAFESYEAAVEAEGFQSVGVRLRECLISFVAETRSEDVAPEGEPAPKAADVKAWTALLADSLASGTSAAALRSYLKKVAVETWDYVNWLTHAKNAIRLDAEIGLKAVEHLLGVFTAAQMRYPMPRCGSCGSYGVVGGECRHCGWINENYEPPIVEPITAEKLARRLEEPCTLSSDIGTFIRPDDLLGSP